MEEAEVTVDVSVLENVEVSEVVTVVVIVEVTVEYASSNEFATMLKVGFRAILNFRLETRVATNNADDLKLRVEELKSSSMFCTYIVTRKLDGVMVISPQTT